jgi:hypothetical protein
MSVYTGSIVTGGEAQSVPIDPNSAQTSVSFVNLSNDLLIISWDGVPASLTHGYKLYSTISIPRAGGSLQFPAGPLSIWGVATNQQFEVLIDQ